MMTGEQHYEVELAGLAACRHGRNVQLLRLALLGLAAGRTPDVLHDEIIAAGGEPRLFDSEVTRAIGKALQIRSDHSSRQAFRGKTAATSPLVNSSNERGFVRMLVSAGKGATSASLMARSEQPVDGPASIWAFLRRIFQPGELVYCGAPFTERTRENLKSIEELAAGGALPTHFIPNPFTGEPDLSADGKVSYCLDSTLAHRRMALVVFNDLPLPEQAAFWTSAIREKVLPVRSLVYSGDKAIHGLVELTDDGTAETWRRQWQAMSRLICSDDSYTYRADRTGKNPSRTSRFPGAIRPETGRTQRLLWLSK